MDHPIAQAPRKTPPPSIGPYQVRRRLAAGGMGEVVLAWDARLRRPVAIKRIRSDLPLTDERRRRFRREAQAAAHFAHPAIVGVHDIVEDAAGDAIVMEYVEGHSLAAAQRRDGIDVATAVDFARQIAEGLAAAHDRGLVHRDLKAENVMVTPEGHCKILDFGLAKPLRELDSLTREGTVLGTVRTMAPEQAKGTDVDARTDLYALGVLLYELLTRRPIFRGANAQEIALQVLTRRPPPLRAVRPELPLRLCRLVDGLLEKDRDARPPNAGLVAAELQALADSPEILGLGAAEDADDRLAASDAQTLPHAARALETGNGRQAFGFSAGLRRAARLRPALLAVVLLAVLGWAAQQTVIAATRSTEALPSSSAESSLPRTPYQLCQQGFRYLDRYDRQGYLDLAIQAFESAIAADSEYALAFSGLARAHRQLALEKTDSSWLDLALSNARRAVELAPQLTHGRATLALVWISRGELEPARQQLETLRLLDPADADVHRALANLALASQQPAAALEHRREAIRLRPDRWLQHSELGVQLQRGGDYEAAAQAFEAAIAIAPDSPYLHLSLGAVYYFLERFELATAAIQDSIEIRPSAPAYSNLGTLHFFLGRYREAARAFEEAVGLTANSSRYWANLGDTYRRLPDRQQDADAAFLRASQLLQAQLADHPDNPDRVSRLALYQSKREHCLSALENVDRLDPLTLHNVTIRYRASLTYELCGARQQALRALGQALEGGYPFHEVHKEPDLAPMREDLAFHHLALRFAS